MPFKKNSKYLQIAFYVLLVVSISIVVVSVVLNFSDVKNFFSGVGYMLSPVLYGLFFAYLINPVLRFLENKFGKKFFSRTLRKIDKKEAEDYVDQDALRRKRNRIAGYKRMVFLLVTYLLVFLIIAAFVLLVAPQVRIEYQEITSNISVFIAQAVEFVEELFLEMGDEIDLISLTGFLQNGVSSFVAYVASFGTSMILTVYQLIFGFILSLYFLVRKERIRRAVKKCAAAIISLRVLRSISEVLQITDRTFGRFFVGKIAESLIIGLINFVVLYALQMPYFALISVVMMIASLIPVFGAFIGGVPCFLLICTESFWMGIWFLVITMAIQQIDGAFIGPKVIGTAVKLDGLWIIVSITLMGGLFGIPGMLIGAPLFSVLYTLMGRFVRSRLQKKENTMQNDAFEATLSSEGILPTYQIKKAFTSKDNRKEDKDD